MLAGAGAVKALDGGGRVVVVGSAAMFDDDWLEKEHNGQLFDWILSFLLQARACALMDIVW